MAVLAPPKPHSHDDLEALVKEARQRQLRRRLFAAAGIAIAAGIALGISALGDSFNQKDSVGSSRPSAPPLCRSSQLSSGYGGFIGASGDVGALVIRNVGSVSCSLLGTPRIVLYSGGMRLLVRQLPANGSVPNSRGPIVHVLAPRKSAYVSFVWSNWCGSSNPMARATFRYFFGGGLVLSQSWGEPGCTARRAPSTLRAAGPLRG